MPWVVSSAGMTTERKADLMGPFLVVEDKAAGASRAEPPAGYFGIAGHGPRCPSALLRAVTMPSSRFAQVHIATANSGPRRGGRGTRAQEPKGRVYWVEADGQLTYRR